MTVTVFAVDTTGLVHFKKPPGDPSQPRMVAIAAILYSPKWEQRGYFEFLIRPEDNTSTPGAKAVHGVSERERELYGVDCRLAMGAFMRFVRMSKEVMAFNMPFAESMINIELTRLNANADDWLRGGLKRSCLRDLAALKWGDGRAMDLPATHERATGLVYEKPQRDKHIQDVRAAARIMMELRRKT